MSILLELVLELLLDVIGCLLEAWFGDWSHTLAGRIFLGVILVLLAGIIWWELR